LIPRTQMGLTRLVRSRRVVILLIVLILTIVTFHQIHINTTSLRDILPSKFKEPDHAPLTAVVVAALEKDVVDWVEMRAGWEVWKYEVDNPNAQHKVPENKGNEANAFLT
jgi:hypothetical protein